MIIRDETSADYAAISEVTEAAFRTLAVSQHTEQFIIKALRAAGALSLSLVAEIEGRVKGHVAFSPVSIADHSPDWYGLGPVSVEPLVQGRGIGSALIREGLARLKQMGARGCVLVGPPEYYQRFGFKNHPRMVHEGIPQEVFLALPFHDRVPRGVVIFHEGFWVTSEGG